MHRRHAITATSYYVPECRGEREVRMETLVDVNKRPSKNTRLLTPEYGIIYTPLPKNTKVVDACTHTHTPQPLSPQNTC